jgi:hypothetical protein
VAGDGLCQGLAALRLHYAKHRRDLGEHVLAGSDRPQVDEPRAVRELILDQPGQLDRQPGLPASATAGERQQPVASQQVGGLCEFR